MDACDLWVFLLAWVNTQAITEVILEHYGNSELPVIEVHAA